MGVPSSATTGTFLPPTMIVPSMFWSLGPWCATYFTHSGAPGKQATMIPRKTPRDAMATRLRRRRRQAKAHVPGVAGAPESASTSTEEADTLSSSFRDLHGREELEVRAVEDQAVHAGGDELGPLPVHERHPRGVPLHDQLVELGPARVAGGPGGHALGLVDEPVHDRVVEVRLVVVADARDALAVQQDVDEVLALRIVLVPVVEGDLRVALLG